RWWHGRSHGARPWRRPHARASQPSSHLEIDDSHHLMRMRVLATLTAAGLIRLLGCSGALPPVPATGPAGSAPPPARQLLVVSALAYGATHATPITYEPSGGSPRIAVGPWAAQTG